MDSDMFIRDVMARPEIWNSKNPHHKNKHKVWKKWDDLKRNYPGLTVDDLKKRWKNLKDTYRKELKRLPQSRPGVTAENFKSQWRYFEALHFLKEEILSYYEKKESAAEAGGSILPDTEKCFDAGPAQSPASTSFYKSDDETTEIPDARTETMRRKDPKVVREEFLKIEKRKMKILEEEMAKSNRYMNSDNYHFLMSLLPEMDKLGPLQKMRLRTKISQAVLDEVSMNAYEDQHTYTNVQDIHFQEATITDTIEIKEEAINMYD